MIFANKTLIKPFICIAFILFSWDANAQLSLIKNTIDKLESYKNFSYQSINKQKEFTSDTVIDQHKDIFSKAPGDKNYGYLFSMETLTNADKSNWTDLYNGQNLMHIVPQNSTFEIYEIRGSEMQGSLPGYLNWIKKFVEKKPSKIAQAGDTTINSLTCSHLIVDKLSGMPDYIIAKSRNANTGNGTTDAYSEIHYFDYKFNQDNIDIASMTPPKGFDPAKEPPVVPLLATGTAAPDWTLYATNGKKISLSQLKGKVILLDFFFIGCIPCMQSIKPLNNLHEKYKGQNVAIVSISDRDSSKKVMTFKEKYNIKYPMYGNEADVAKLYHVTAGPTFYFINKEGKIADVNVGYSDDFEERVTSIINNLLNKP